VAEPQAALGAARKATFGLLSAFLLLALLAGCQRDAAPIQFSGKTMGTHYNVTVVAGEGERTVDAGELQAAVDKRLAAVNQSMSTYIEDSELNQLNAAPVGEWITISAELYDVLLQAMEVSWLSGGAFDVTVGPLVDLWGFTNFLVEIGGELRLAGHSPRGTPWRIAVERPDGLPGEVQQALTLSEVGLATSGDYRNYFEQNGERFSHTIDPSTGAPTTHGLASVTVVAHNAAYADALATALEVLGPEKAKRLAAQQDLAIFLIAREGEAFVTWHSPAFESYLGKGRDR
jgi:thiamine biosynthesis lipoprotein ApbE